MAILKRSSKTLGFRLAEAFQEAGRTTISTAMHVAPLPGFEEVKDAALKLVNSIQSLETHQAKRVTLSRRITSIIGMLQTHLRRDEPSLELQYFFNKMVMCQKRLLELESGRGVSKALRATQQVELMELLEREISSDFQDAILALLLQRLPPSPGSEPQPVVKISEPVPEIHVVPSPSPPPTHDYQRIPRCELSLNTIVRRTRGNEPGSPLVKSIASGRYRGRNVLVVQYSSKIRQQSVLKAFLDDVSTVIQERHPNILEFIGASDCSSQCHFMVFDGGDVISRDAFLRSTHSAEQIFTFLAGVKSGMQCLLDHGVRTWHDIYVSDNGRAIIHPPYWECDFLWEKSNHDVFSSITGVDPNLDFPLSTLSEILNISGHRWKDVESAVVSRPTYIRDYHLMEIADELNLPIPPFLLVYYGKVPDFILSVGSVGIPDYVTTGQAGDCFHGSMTGWTLASSLWCCAGWEALHTYALEFWIPSASSFEVDDELSLTPPSGSLSVEPLESSSDGWLSYGYFESESSFGVAYEFAISDAELFQMSWDRFCVTRLGSLAHLADEVQDFHAVKHVSVSIHCHSESLRGLYPLYFHRRPSSLFNIEHYWGFFSDNPDPDAKPCHMVRNMAVNYSIEINTIRANDSWAYRSNKCMDTVMAKTPGIFPL
ncbi:hypothetical protein FRC07_002103 [Ceratobasidium sp. 392]|nr:hypothetical protein FRC07_002103 [Ceratobasidium sp. 392]